MKKDLVIDRNVEVLGNLTVFGTMTSKELDIDLNILRLQSMNLREGDILAVKLIGNDFDEDVMNSLKDHLSQVFTKNRIMVFTMPKNSDIVFEAITPPSAEGDCSEEKSYCSDCSCGKKEQIEGANNG